MFIYVRTNQNDSDSSSQELDLSGLVYLPFLDMYLTRTSYFLYSVGFTYIIPITCFFGLIISMIVLVVLSHPKLKGDTYKYLIMKTILQLMIYSSHFFNLSNVCLYCPIFLTYSGHIVRAVFFNFMMPFASIAYTLVEVLLCVERLRIFRPKSKLLPPLNFSVVACLIITISAGMSIPPVIAFKLVPFQGRYIMVANEIGTSQPYAIYTYAMTAITTYGFITILIVSNFFVIHDYKKYIKKKNKMTNKTTATNVMNMTQLQAIKATYSKKKNIVAPIFLTTDQATHSIGPNTSMYNISVSYLNMAKNDESLNETNLNREIVTNKTARMPAKSKEANSSATLTPMVIISSVLYITNMALSCVTSIWETIAVITNASDLGEANRITAFLIGEISLLIMYLNLFIYVHFNRNFKECLFEIVRKLRFAIRNSIV
jgi:hypothetical protein